MKIIQCLAIVIVLQACGSSSKSDSASAPGACASSVVAGSWKGSIYGNQDVMTFDSSCSGSSTYCQSSFTFPNVTATEGYISVSNNSTNGKSGCAGLETVNCAYRVNGSTLSFNCGGGTLSYTKQ